MNAGMRSAHSFVRWSLRVANVKKKDEPMNDATATIDLDNGVLLRLLALAMDKLQRRRRRPKKPGRLHRV